MKRNYIVSPRNSFVNESIAKNDQYCGENGQCTKFECQEWIDTQPAYPELVREERGFAICPKCGASYGRDAMTGKEYKQAKVI